MRSYPYLTLSLNPDTVQGGDPNAGPGPDSLLTCRRQGGLESAATPQTSQEEETEAEGIRLASSQS